MRNNRISSLILTLVKNNLPTFEINGKRKLGSKILYILLLLYVGVIVAYGSHWLLQLLIPLQEEKLFLAFIISASVMFTFIQTLLSCASFLYFAKENEFLLPMPLNPKELLAAKTAVSLVYIYVSEIFIGLIPLICYGCFTAQPFYFYLMLIPVLIVLPVFPVCLASFIIIVLFSFIKLTRYKSLFHVLSVILALVMSAGISVFVNSSDQSSVMMNLLSQGGDILELYKYAFPSVSYAIDTLRCSSLLYTLTNFTVLALISVLVFTVYLFVSEKMFMRGLLNSLYGSNIFIKKSVSARSFNSRGVAYSYIKKEFANLFRNSVYLTQIIMPAAILPFIMIAVFAYSLYSNAGSDIQVVLRMAERWTRSSEASLIMTMIILGLLFFSSMYVYSSVTGISRDGEDALFMKQIPVPFYKQILYKSVPDFALNFVSYFLYLLVIIFFIRFPAKFFIMGIFAGAVFSYVHGLLFLLIDLRKPKIHWLNEYEVAKNNFKFFFVMIFALLNFGIMAGLFFAGIRNYLVYFSVFMTAYILIAVILTAYIRKKDIRLADTLY